MMHLQPGAVPAKLESISFQHIASGKCSPQHPSASECAGIMEEASLTGEMGLSDCMQGAVGAVGQRSRLTSEGQ